LSIGIQSFQDTVLKFLNRAHDGGLAEQSVKLAREVGFENISIDLIYGIPGQSDAEWLENIRKGIQLQPEHISSYSLTIEDKTVFGRWAASGKFTPVQDDVAARQLEILVDELERAGYDQYEVSNFSKPGFESRHNSNYWKEQKYLGIGPSAHSYNLTSRQFTISNNHLYIKSLREGRIPFEKEELSVEDHANEYLLTTLRTRWGVNLEQMKQRFNYDIVANNQDFIQELIKRKLAVIENGFLKLTRAGKLLADKISSELFLVS
jgi:oxygen-independent coproporphyrinogen-3 oxidase